MQTRSGRALANRAHGKNDLTGLSICLIAANCAMILSSNSSPRRNCALATPVRLTWFHIGYPGSAPARSQAENAASASHW
jgi:hypothetical protein